MTHKPPELHTNPQDDTQTPRMTHNGRKEKAGDSSSGPRSTAIEIEEQTAVKVQVVNSSVATTLPDKIVPDDSCRNDPRWVAAVVKS